MWQQILSKCWMSHLAACTHLWVGFLKNPEISGISDRCFSETRWYFSCVIFSAVDANQCITNPSPLQFRGSLRHLAVAVWVVQPSHPTLAVVPGIREPCRELCTPELWWMAVPSAQMLFGVPSLSNSSCSVFHTELRSWLPSVFLFPLHCCILLKPPLIVECLQLIMAVTYSKF